MNLVDDPEACYPYFLFKWIWVSKLETDLYVLIDYFNLNWPNPETLGKLNGSRRYALWRNKWIRRNNCDIRSGFSACWTLINFHLCVSSTHTPDHSHSRPWSESALYMFWEMLALDLQFLPCQIHGMAAMNSAAPAFFLPNLWVRLLTLLPEGASVPGSCACVSESGDRKWGRVWCHPPPKFTILVMAVNTNFLVGLQRLRKDFYFLFLFY